MKPIKLLVTQQDLKNEALLIKANAVFTGDLILYKTNEKYPSKRSTEACNFMKKETLAQVFSCECCERCKNTFFTEHVRQLLLLFERLEFF